MGDECAPDAAVPDIGLKVVTLNALHEAESRAYVALEVTRARHIWRDLPFDIGMDGEIELLKPVDGGGFVSTFKSIRVQLKAARAFRVVAKTQNYLDWARAPYPVIAIVYNHEEKKAMWADVRLLGFSVMMYQVYRALRPGTYKHKASHSFAINAEFNEAAMEKVVKWASAQVFGGYTSDPEADLDCVADSTLKNMWTDPMMLYSSVEESMKKMLREAGKIPYHTSDRMRTKKATKLEKAVRQHFQEVAKTLPVLPVHLCKALFSNLSDDDLLTLLIPCRLHYELETLATSVAPTLMKKIRRCANELPGGVLVSMDAVFQEGHINKVKQDWNLRSHKGQKLLYDHRITDYLERTEREPDSSFGVQPFDPSKY